MKRLTLSVLIAACAAVPAHADEAELRARVDQLSAQLEALKAEIKAMHSQTEAIATQQEVTSAKVAAVVNSPAAPSEPSTTIWGYGEVNYTQPKDRDEAKMDMRRAVIGVGHRFDEKTRLNAEFEVEHGVVSADDEGEVEVEQFYIDHQLANYASVKAGLFLIPAGLLNESHEPTRYYGVERNFVETAIIPTTWREGGVGVHGSFDSGLAYDVGITTGFDLSKWDATDAEGQESPLGAAHQELQNAKARDLSQYLALNYRGVPGFLVGGSAFTGKAAQGDDTFASQNIRVTLWDLHTRWTPGDWDLSALYARGDISGADAANYDFRFRGNEVLIPKSFYGWYTQAAYKVWQSGTYAVTPFVRYERFSTGTGYDGLPQGMELDAQPLERVWTYGLNFNLNDNVVIKTDIQRFKEDSSRNRFDLGLGLAF
jgi:outer membrane murein-binding lipoprotein Lpp